MHVLNVIELHRGASYGKVALINNKVINAPTDLRWWNLTWGFAAGYQPQTSVDSSRSYVVSG
jgi:hypothetical protein